MADVPSIPRFAVLTGAMLILAGLDIFGALMAKQWADQGSRPCFLIGLAIFAVLFTVYATSLKTAELSVVTMGWVVLLQVGLLLADRFRFQVEFSWDKWLAIAIILILQSYLIRSTRSVERGHDLNQEESFRWGAVSLNPHRNRGFLLRCGPTRSKARRCSKRSRTTSPPERSRFRRRGTRGAWPKRAARILLGDGIFRADIWLNTAGTMPPFGPLNSSPLNLERGRRRLVCRQWVVEWQPRAVDGVARPGRPVIVARDAHMSVLTGLILTGARSRFRHAGAASGTRARRRCRPSRDRGRPRCPPGGEAGRGHQPVLSRFSAPIWPASSRCPRAQCAGHGR